MFAKRPQPRGITEIEQQFKIALRCLSDGLIAARHGTFPPRPDSKCNQYNLYKQKIIKMLLRTGGMLFRSAEKCI